MVPGPPTSLRALLDNRIEELLGEIQGFCDSRTAERVGEACARVRRETAACLNQAVRRLRQASGAEELAATLVDTAAAYASGAALLRVEGDTVAGERIRGVCEEKADAYRGLRIPLASASALAGAAEGADPVTAVTAPAEVSAELTALLEHPEDGRVSIFPIASTGRATALVYAWGDVDAPAIELLAQVAAALWPPEQPPALVAIEPAPAEAAAPKSGWDSLPPAERQVHLSAQRFARVQAAEMRLRQAAAVHAGRARRDLYAELSVPIDAARAAFREKFFTACPSMVDYLHLELLRTLANDDLESLGKNYPGPLA